MKKLGRNSLAVGLATLLVTSAVAFSAQADDAPVAQSNSSASTGTGLFSQLDLDSGICEAIFPEFPSGDGRCGPGLDTTGIDAFDQIATAAEDGRSSAEAAVAPVQIDDFTSLDLTDLLDDISVINTETVLDPVLQGLDPITQGLLRDALAPLITPLDDALQQILASLNDAVPVSLEVGAVEAQCTAIPGSAEGSSSIVGGLRLLIELAPGQNIEVPITAGTAPNSNLLVGAPEDLVDGIIDGLEETLTLSLGGLLEPLNLILAGVQEQVLDHVFEALEPALLEPLANALSPLVAGVVNKQVPVSPSSTGEIDVTALDLTLLETNNLQLGRVSCGPNGGPIDTVDDAVSDGPGLDGPGNDDVVDGPGDNVAGRDGGPGGAIADADAQADADVSVALPNAGAPNLLPFWLLGLGLVLFGAAVMINERRRALL